MNFLIKIEDAINQFIEKLLVKLKAATPAFVFEFIVYIQQLPTILKKKWQALSAKWRIMGLKTIGYTEHYTTMVRGYIMSVIMYLRSDEFKQADKTKLFLKPLRYAKIHPLKAISALVTVCVLTGAGMIIYKNTEKIVLGTKALRKPASFASAEEDVFIEFKNHKFEVKLGSAGGGHGAAGAEEHEYALHLDVKIEAQNETEKAFLEDMEEMLDDNLEALDLKVTELPLVPENQKQIEEAMTKSLNEDFKRIGHANPIKSIKLKQVLPGRPKYFRQAEKTFSIVDINLQLFLEDTHRNRQVWLDFSVLASNRNVVLYLKDHEVELKDHLSTNVEPVIPQLPVEEEGRQIIKDKLKSEIDQFLEKNHVEGTVLEIYIDYLLVS